ncbi:Arm DNA-binding domain-containing protein [Enterococcus faecium]|nr:Arm DNA-binding domain-containing protein [Enterococcus faecium]
MARVDKYIKKNGETAYKFRIFLGLDYNGKQKYIKKSGFSTKKQALEKLAEIEGKIESEQKYIQLPVVLVNFNILKNISKFLQNVVVFDLIEHCKPVICFQIYSLAL